MLLAYVFVGLCLVLCDLTMAKEIPLPIFMKDVPTAGKVKFTEIISRADLQPAQRQQLIDQLISTQSAAVQQSYQSYKKLMDEHKKKFGVSLESELEKARQAYIKTNGHA
ncbi:hypothetical protein M3Y97_00546200 [Aphelenchoides bicaudatus]|nr:hypothetical protein M3Y97_00546200 [Aphelenchoides bicaudatus]